MLQKDIVRYPMEDTRWTLKTMEKKYTIKSVSFPSKLLLLPRKKRRNDKKKYTHTHRSSTTSNKMKWVKKRERQVEKTEFENSTFGKHTQEYKYTNTTHTFVSIMFFSILFFFSFSKAFTYYTWNLCFFPLLVSLIQCVFFSLLFVIFSVFFSLASKRAHLFRGAIQMYTYVWCTLA